MQQNRYTITLLKDGNKADGCSDFLSAMANAKLVSPPYSKPLYSNNAFSLLGYALEQESGESFGTLLEQDVFSPLNMDRTTTKLPPSDQKEYDTWLERGAFGDEAVLASYIASEGTSEA
jgi:CubicO group peptidase (beta-lactamase class C family)